MSFTKRLEEALIVVALIFIGFAVVSCADEIPHAIQAENVNQHRIAAKVINHTPGYYEYQQFTQNNK